MSITRRNLLKAILVFSGAAALGYFALWRVPKIRNRLVKMFKPELKSSPPGPIDDNVAGTLTAAAKSLISFDIDEAHYEDYFRWRASHLKGYKHLYDQLARSFNKLAARKFNLKFIDCDSSRQRELIMIMRPSGKFDTISMKIFHEDYLLAEHYFFKEVLTLFTLTDAWVAIGYRKWPGQPRGLSYYTKPARVPELT